MAKQKITQAQYETVLYNNATGETGTVTLSETSANFNYIEIFFKDEKSLYSSVKIYSPNGKSSSLSTHCVDTGAVSYYSKNVTVSGTSITSTIGYVQIFTAGSSSGYNNSNGYILITRVVGYK